jgi:hypothetical protein
MHNKFHEHIKFHNFLFRIRTFDPSKAMLNRQIRRRETSRSQIPNTAIPNILPHGKWLSEDGTDICVTLFAVSKFIQPTSLLLLAFQTGLPTRGHVSICACFVSCAYRLRPHRSHAHARGPSSCSMWLRQVSPTITCVTPDILLQHLDEILATYV